MSQILFNEINTEANYTEMLTNYTNDLREMSLVRHEEKSFSRLRNFPMETDKECGVFFVGDATEMLLPDYLDVLEILGVISETNRRPIFHNRYVIPIKDSQGNVCNLVGYSNESKERYIYGTSMYYSRTDTLWGLENLGLAYELGYAIVTEGITDAIRLRSMGYKNTFAMCGTHRSDNILRQLNRCRHGIIRVPDRDNAGLAALKGWDFNRHMTLYVNLKYKDADEMCREEENIPWFKAYMDECIKWLLLDEHRGQKCLCESVSIL